MSIDINSLHSRRGTGVELAHRFVDLANILILEIGQSVAGRLHILPIGICPNPANEDLLTPAYLYIAILHAACRAHGPGAVAGGCSLDVG